MKIGILQTGHSPDTLRNTLGDYEHLFHKLLGSGDFEFETFNVVDMEFPSSVNDCDGWLLTGSRHGAYEDHPFIPPLETFIRDAYAAHVPMVGICFGHQIIAQALGGKVEKFKGGWVVGRQTYELEGQKVALNAWHQDQVVVRPQGATVVASNEMCENAALVYDDRIFTVQAHPEFRSDYIEGLATTRGPGVVPDPLLERALNNLDKPTDNDLLARRITDFFKTKASSHERLD